ncbi:hypothetical protein [Photobacterium sp. OFAV2-7]|uniref:hypothetical protein n=1 Tax=Photobacterium sp. OFAV2-7 TaxID=2917748 RepID=UPI001EF3F080|nr:hypothetical protein [Photobacterium sp. OFAV2-7]MCG7584354.1 hypothetical protein [Photobacterium sp. OFAV2-7]
MIGLSLKLVAVPTTQFTILVGMLSVAHQILLYEAFSVSVYPDVPYASCELSGLLARRPVNPSGYLPMPSMALSCPLPLSLSTPHTLRRFSTDTRLSLTVIFLEYYFNNSKVLMNKNLVAIPLKTFIIIVSKEWQISYKLLSYPRFFSVSCH